MVVCTSGGDDDEEDDEEEGAGGIALETLNASAGHVRTVTQLKANVVLRKFMVAQGVGTV